MNIKQPLIPPPPPHVLIFPLPLQGPINCNLKLAELLCISGIHVTFLNTDHIHRQLLLHTDVHSRFSRYPHFSFQTVPDGLSKDHPRSIDCFDELIQGIEAVTKPIFREIVSSGGRSSGRPVTCIIADGIFDFAVDVAVENRISIFYFETLSPCCVWAYLCISKLIEDGQLPFKGNDLDAPISCVPGSEVLIRQRDLPGLFRNYNPAKPTIEFELALNQGKQLKRAQGLILNTFEELERPILSQLRSICPNTYAIGPLHAHFKTRLVLQTKFATSNSSNSLWEEEKHCIDWLDKQPTKSVIYINMGSLVVTTMDQLIEFWHGLVNSGKRFLWVRRPGSIIGYEDTYVIPEELSNGTKERGCIVSWVAQEEVLAHSAIGAFLTHSGWNSTLESIIEGVPMICWPHHADQQVNSRFVSEVWKLGMDMKDTCDRVVIEKMVMDIMGVKFENEIMQSVDMTAKLGKESIAKGGSSYNDLNRLIDDVNLASM